MKTRLNRSGPYWQRGYVSIIAILALAMVVLVILMQSVRRTGSDALETQQYHDSVAALAAAESGIEIAKGKMFAAFNSGSTLSTICDLSKFSSLTPQSIGTQGKFTFVSATPAGSGAGAYCKIRVKGTVRNANRILETWIGIKEQFGTSGFGTTASLSLSNKYPGFQTLAVYDLAWRLKGSDGHDALTAIPGSQIIDTSNNAFCIDCSATNKSWINMKNPWTIELGGESNALGGAGGSDVANNVDGSATFTRSISSNRNYLMVGLQMGGTASTAPAIVGGITFSNVATAQTTASGKDQKNCPPETNALVLGVSGRGMGMYSLDGKTAYTTPNFNAGFNTITLNNIFTFTEKYVHYPDIGGGTPYSYGDIFAEIFFYFKNPVTNIKPASIGIDCPGKAKSCSNPTVLYDARGATKIHINSTTGLSKNDYITDGNKIPYGSQIVSIGTDDLSSAGGSASTPYITITGTGIQSGFTGSETICSGICGLLPNGANNAFLTGYGTNATLNKGWAAGLACIVGADPNKVSAITSSSLRVIQWHEVVIN